MMEWVWMILSILMIVPMTIFWGVGVVIAYSSLFLSYIAEGFHIVFEWFSGVSDHLWAKTRQ